MTYELSTPGKGNEDGEDAHVEQEGASLTRTKHADIIARAHGEEPQYDEESILLIIPGEDAQATP